ncbi:hypothetical protein N7495_000494 [Penicillium taxi]|uniref:uncharacterized protein n=1 Tax=Penicillium taxi TaxID=168475 RepID=UPI002545B0A8|nr:uncharacterized protein N7495_000494 [Penicillium taxi]KAJ5907812.1 hypothetical protein N7495_000494 [Penicillium taxi]
MAAFPIEDSNVFEDLINRPEPSIWYFFTGNDGPGPEFQPLLSGAVGIEAFFVDIDQCNVQRDLNKLPQTVLYKGGEELGVAYGGDMDTFFELCERGQSEA